MKTFKAFLSELSEKESDAEYNLRMKKTTRTLKRSARKGKRNKKRNVIKRRTKFSAARCPEKIASAARAQAKREVLGKLGNMKPSVKKKKVERKATMIDRKTMKLKRVLKKQEPQRIKAAKASRLKK